MALAVGLDMLSAVSPASLQPDADSHLSRKRRMNFFDLANLLDSDGNLQNEMMVFAFAATMLSTIPILLGNEFDVNVGLKRRRRETGPYSNPDETKTMIYSHTGSSAFTSGYTYYETLMTSTPGALTLHELEPLEKEHRERVEADASVTELLGNLLQWSKMEVKNRSLLSNLGSLLLEKYNGNSNPADKLVISIYKKWRKNWYQ